MDDAVHLDDGLVVFSREGIYQMRLKIAPQRYSYKSLRTRDRMAAIKLAQREFLRMEFMREEGAIYAPPPFKRVLAEYTAHRQKEFERGKTSVHMMRQIKRVQQFWVRYAGNTAVDKIGDSHLAEYVEWRRAYWSTVKPKLRPKNISLNPSDKTLHWELTFAKSVLKWAHKRGYRGKKPLPTETFTVKNKRVRPSFELNDYRALYKAMRRRIHATNYKAWKDSRIMLRDYVLILANSGVRVGELNGLRLRDIHPFKDDLGRENYRFVVSGKTGKRDVILRAAAKTWVDRAIQRRRAEGAIDDDYLFAMSNGKKVQTLIDQFKELLKSANLSVDTFGEPFTLYSLRHFYAIMSLRRGKGVFEVARNMGTSVQMIQSYYGKQATAQTFATSLGN